MARFCTKCGKPLEEGKICNCQPKPESKFIVFIKKQLGRMGIGEDTNTSSNPLATKKKIVPDIIKSNEGETPIKQYEAATLRSRIRGQYAKGKLQVTNKRLLFRADGASYQGRITVQQEFAIDEIAGVEIKKTNRISPLNIILSILSYSIISTLFSNLFSHLALKAQGTALFLSIIIAVGSAIPFFILKKKFWIKLLIMNCGMGCLLGTGELTNLSPETLIFGLKTNIADIVSVIFFVFWFLNMILVSLVPNLTLCIKTKGASEAINVRRKQFATLFKQEVEHTGFSEVLPGKDIDIMTNELGALINDIQIFGERAIENWKEV